MEQLVNFIIRPPRADYNPKNDLLEEEFMLKGQWFQRKDLEITNVQGNKLQCSHYMPLVVPEGKQLPCVVYCHGNSGCRADASEAAIILLPTNITLFTLDFSGSGLSDGEHVTLGWNEKNDLKAVINHLRSDGSISCIGLWGRSMGAVTSLMYGAEDPSIAGMVLDSPFSILVELMMELVDTYKYPLPKFTVKLAIQHLRRVIKKKANFDIMELDAIKVAKCCFVPALIGHGIDDDFIRPHHSDRIYEVYAGDKNIIKFDGDHNSPRPQFYFDSITIFFHNVLNPPEHYFDELGLHAMPSSFGEGNCNTVYEIDDRKYALATTASELGSSSTEDALLQLRSRRPMSRTEVPPDISQVNQQITEGNESGSDSQLSSTYVVPDGLQQSNSTPLNDEYVEFIVGDFPDMPGSMEEEERMLMEAIMRSLKEMDFEVAPKGDEPSTTTKTTEADVNNNNDNITFAAAAVSSAEPNLPLEAAVHANPEPSHEILFDGASRDNGDNKYPLSSESACDGTSSGGGGSCTIHEDMVGTRATLVVQKSLATGIVDGLTQRLGQFFKNQ